ncbi:MAG: hypothetical protein KAX40_04240 [Herpetosiphon sp.]|nr:hypothetical protein [Herpetosiphon sp.]
MWEYLIGYVSASGDAPCVVEERSWHNRHEMDCALLAEGWEVLEEADHRPNMHKIVYRREIKQAGEMPRHLLPCW